MEECPICLETCQEVFKSSCCNKIFHKECYEKCLNINNTCPTCRNVFIKVEEDYQVEIKFNTWNYRFIISFCGALFGVMVVFGFLGVMAFAIITKGGSDTVGTNMTNGTSGNF
jgi:hypothetical protein